MTRYLLDTNIISDLVRQPQGRAAKRIAEIGDRQILTSVIVAAELRYGCRKAGSARLSATVEALLSEIETIPFDEAASRTYADLRTALEARGKPIGGNDMLIAAQALALGCIVVTANIDEFAHVDGLEVENWLA
ncbi:type II toxin-antitoxin system VapC family toxin [Bosea sp. CCNWLW174]|uniref:Ribonuclease VapC n=1 Tax=Bosea lupini TaxID=1036779 RepID=A0A1H7Z5U3_9HYPH|nr:type II toxin-antitoxin system VapC family toxin [Bosea lupini]SEM52849.1 tRNA(fMet)-specific endonuclease VapC [Bosea lupini]